MNTKHTPTPWHLGIKQAEKIVYDAKGWAICNCTVYHGHGDGEPQANAALIVRAVNSHAALVEALERLEEGVRLWITKPVEEADMVQARAALKLAKGEG